MSLTALVERARALVRSTPPAPPASRLYASDYLTPHAAFPLVYVTDISNWSEDRQTGQVSFTLTNGMRYAHEAANFQCKVPFSDGDLFEKRGAYLVVILPATSQAQVDRVRRAAGGGS
jgi:hypothetical protein